MTALEQSGVLVLDGAMATELERHGADLSGGLWSARVLMDQPELVAQVHRDYLAAGADITITASYQASLTGYAAAGVGRDQAEQLIHRSVRLAVIERDRFWAPALESGFDPIDTVGSVHRPRPVVATSVGPYGAVLADGSEYRGDYGVSYAELVRFHRERLEVLAAGGVEVLACETIPSRLEAEALVEALGGWPELTAWMSFSARNADQISDGTPLAEVGAFLDRQDQIVAVGVNCTAPQHISPLIRALSDSTDKPVVVYPNSGETYDAKQQRWLGQRSAADFESLAGQWFAAGARIVGGCCRTRAADIRAVALAAATVRGGHSTSLRRL